MAAIPTWNGSYKAEAYWDARFEEEDSYEWLGGWDDVGEGLLEVVDGKILVIGNGPSQCRNQDIF